ncbi:MFS transporter [Helicobacter cholecystus]|uniref:MFS transporter n=1 Tax=Helicobacter cholecystus TaxID=45498 RepID=UPI00273A13FE|nr:MFS transporter [Helicobacter cholecystus]
MKLHSSYFCLIPLSLGAFCMGVAELVIAGMLEKVGIFFNVDAQSAGYLVAIYAFGVILGAPLLTIPLSRIDRKKQFLCNMGIFALANAVVYLSDNFYLTAVARFVAGCMHGVFFVIATLIAFQVAQKGKETQALSLVVAGLTLSMISGVPLGAWVGNYFGFQSVFLLVFSFALFTFFLALFLMPKTLTSIPTHFHSLVQSCKSLPMIKVFFITACFCGSLFAFYTYVEPFFLSNDFFDKDKLSWVLLFYGLCGIGGNFFGGILTDKKGSRYALLTALGTLSLSLLLMSWSIKLWFLAVINFGFVGFWAFTCVSPLKKLAMEYATRHTPETIESSISMNEASFNIGIASASLISGAVLTYFGVSFVPLCAFIIAFIPVILLWRARD